MDQTIRNKLRGVVTQCRKLLEDSTAQALQGRFGIYAARKKGEVQIEDEARMAHLTEEDRACRQDLLDHLEHIQAIGYKPSEALEQLVREVSFTHLNRLCAYKMMESRGFIREAVSRGLKSQGFFFYLADHQEDEKLHNGGGQETAYRNFLDWLGGTLSEEIGVLFNPNDPANRIYPPQRVLDDVLDLINDGELKDIWSQDETIGWVYQYFTPKELRDKARKESQAPRNSYELAFRNQFFTPRYVVEFLTDNTLGRIWYEMRKGETVLKDRCKYLVRRPREIFLDEGSLVPGHPSSDNGQVTNDTGQMTQEELLKQPVYIPHRPKKDPRELKVLDPACGSGHFLLYCFDLLQTIYEEAWGEQYVVSSRLYAEGSDKLIDLISALKTIGYDYSNSAYCPLPTAYYSLQDLRRAVPGLVLKHNLYGIDIDLRATQIAALALWLRCQRAYQELGLKNGERPKITRSNIVCAEPMPGETDLLKEFTSTLQPKVLGQLVETVFEKMKLAGEAGSLLKIEEEIREAASKAKFEFIQWKKHQDKAKWSLFPELVKRDQPSIFDFADMTDEMFLDRVEEEIVGALQQYAEQASNGKGFRRQLFTEDTARGFGFLDLSNHQYDVVLMNPPFGEFSKAYKAQARNDYPNSYNDIFAAFTERWYGRLEERGALGAISSRVGFFLTSFRAWRTEFLLRHHCLGVLADLGEAVMDEALVESAAYILTRTRACKETTVVRLLGQSERAEKLRESIAQISEGNCSCYTFIVDVNGCTNLPDAPVVYWVDPAVVQSLTSHPRFEPTVAEVRQGLVTGDNPRFTRAIWEVPLSELNTRGQFGPDSNAIWAPLVMKGPSQPWYSPITVVVNWRNDGHEIKNFVDDRGKLKSRPQNIQYYFRPGLSWTRRAVRFIPYAIPKGCIPTASRYMAFPANGYEFSSLGVTASNIASAFLRFFGEWFCRPNFLVENVKSLPWPSLPDALLEQLKTLVSKEVADRRMAYQAHEPFHDFLAPSSTRPCDNSNALTCDLASFVGEELECAISRAYGFDGDQTNTITRDLREAVQFKMNGLFSGTTDDDEDDNDRDDSDFVVQNDERTQNESIVSYSVGVAFGRWDIRFATGERQPPELPDPFDPLPVCPPGMLQGPDGLPAKPEDVPSDYPIRIDWDGILVDDPGHEDDIVRRVRDVLEVIWKDRAEAIELEACEILGVRELRDYFRKPAGGGFWMDHVKRYSKSRRKAPNYWYLRSARGNYGLWLYYHRLDKDILFKALLNYVEPKIRQVSMQYAEGRRQLERAKEISDTRQMRQLEKEMDRLDSLLSELRDFEEKLRRVANLHLNFDLNDGVILNIAPLWELVPWNEPKKYWEELQEGKYDWAHIALQLWPERVKQICKKDRSIAIAHGLENLFEDQSKNNISGKLKKGRRRS